MYKSLEVITENKKYQHFLSPHSFLLSIQIIPEPVLLYSVFWVCYPSWIPAKTNDCNSLKHVQITCLFKWPQNACVVCCFELSSLNHVLCMCITYASVWKIRFCRSQVEHLIDDMSPTHTFCILHVGRGIWVHTPTNTKITHILPSTIKN